MSIILLRTENKVISVSSIVLLVIGAIVGVFSMIAWYYLVGFEDRGSDSPTVVISEVAFKGYNSIEGLAGYADVVVVGTVGEVLGREIDAGGNADSDGGIPTIFYRVQVNERLQGEPGDTIVLARTDSEIQYSNYEKPVEIGQQYVFFLLDRTGDAPGFKKFKDVENLYVTAGLDNGVFELSEDDIASPRWPSKFRVDEKSADEAVFKSFFTVDEIRASIASELPDGSDDHDELDDLLTEEPIGTPVSVSE